MSGSANKKHAKRNGRPTKYKVEFIKAVDKYIDKCKDKYVDKKLQVCLPSLRGFASYLGVHRETLNEWAKRNKGFSDTLERIKYAQHEKLINSGLSGAYNSTITKLLLLSNHGYAEKKEEEHNCRGALESFLRERPLQPGDLGKGVPIDDYDDE